MNVCMYVFIISQEVAAIVGFSITGQSPSSRIWKRSGDVDT
jgi:hypothetical protein